MLNVEDISANYLYETFLAKRASKTQVIYITVVIAVIAFLCSMPWIKITLSVQGSGIIRPISEKAEVKSLVSEIIEQTYVLEGQYVKKGSPILKLRTDPIDNRLRDLQLRQNQYMGLLDDLEQLTRNSKHPVVHSLEYQLELNSFQIQRKELQGKLEKSALDYEKHKKLFETGVIALDDLENYTHQLASVQSELQMHKEAQLSRWYLDRMKHQAALQEINIALGQAQKERDLYTISAPVSGTVEQFSGIYMGSAVQKGETVAIISPDSTLIAEFFISPKDIGYLNKDSKVVIQIDAFHYNEWGVLHGKILNVSSDFMIIQNTPMFRVRCALDRNYLALQNGYKGYLKKGMTVRGRFQIARRSLFQLLYQRADDWLNPTQFSCASTVGKIKVFRQLVALNKPESR
jgi:HlyD family secretion protein